MAWQGSGRGHLAGHLPGQVRSAIVVDHQRPQVPVAAKALHGADIAASAVQGLGNGRMPQPVRPDL